MSALRPYEPGRDPLNGYVTRDGKEVRILATDALLGSGSIVALVKTGPNAEVMRWYDSAGLATGSMGLYKSDHDLMCVPVPHTIWANIYREAKGHFLERAQSRAEADAKVSAHMRVACIQITFNEGDGL